MGSRCDRIDIVFDRYRPDSIKRGTGRRRTKTCRPIRRVIENRDVPLPNNWPGFLAMEENKADLADFLSKEIVFNARHDTAIVTSGGFREELMVKSSEESIALVPLVANHEEADSRIVLHAVNMTSDMVIVNSTDTDVLILLVSHFSKMKCKDLWLLCCTAKKRKYIPVKAIYQRLPSAVIKHLISFHAVTGCDTTSFTSGYTKKRAWKVFLEIPSLLADVGVGNHDREHSIFC